MSGAVLGLAGRIGSVKNRLFRVVTVFGVVVYTGASVVAFITGHSALGIGFVALALTWAPLRWLRGMWERDGWVRGFVAAHGNERAFVPGGPERGATSIQRIVAQRHCGLTSVHDAHLIYREMPTRAFWCVGVPHDHAARCCFEHGHHVNPHTGCFLR